MFQKKIVTIFVRESSIVQPSAQNAVLLHMFGGSQQSPIQTCVSTGYYKEDAEM